jgi:hypothetical protein
MLGRPILAANTVVIIETDDFSRAVQPVNTYSPVLVILAGIITEVRPVQY